MGENSIKMSICKYSNKAIQEITDFVTCEYPLTLFVNGKEIVTVVCSPDNLKELAVGFLFSEGFISSFQDILEMECEESDGLFNIKLAADPMNTDSFLRRKIASCCGKGRAGLYFINDARQVKEVKASGSFKADYFLEQMAWLEKNSQSFHLTGGVHCAALVKEAVICMYEDIGRHNAVDKVLGALCIEGLETKDTFLMLSGRVSSEIVIKTARADIPFIVSKSAPTDLAIGLAEELNITMIGFARGQSLNIYTHPERIN
ncbi:MAG: formate dehydrogenase accessory sulfurtransferase FdhD [Peptococcaceae bacterium]|nr:formate dehydrogenase accessory sulfurtransferase FdhD [Peptococcaceae bacterium]